jgi:hypothetical protein
LAVKDARAALTYGQLVDRAVAAAAAAAMHAKGAVGGDIVRRFRTPPGRV